MSEIRKFQQAPQESDRQRRAVTAGLSGVGAAAGAAGLTLAGHNLRRGFKSAPKELGTKGRLLRAVGKEKFATALIPLEVAGLGGEVMATHILHNDAKQSGVKKADSLPACLQRLLTDVVFMYKQAHLAHWNVTGPNFASMHEFFSDVYSDVYDSIDPIAENMRKIGVQVPSSALTQSAPIPTGQDPMSLSSALMATNARVQRGLEEAFSCADGHDGLQNFLAERIDMHSKWAWQLRSICGGVSKASASELFRLGGVGEKLANARLGGVRGLPHIGMDDPAAYKAAQRAKMGKINIGREQKSKDLVLRSPSSVAVRGSSEVAGRGPSAVANRSGSGVERIARSSSGDSRGPLAIEGPKSSYKVEVGKPQLSGRSPLAIEGSKPGIRQPRVRRGRSAGPRQGSAPYTGMTSGQQHEAFLSGRASSAAAMQRAKAAQAGPAARPGMSRDKKLVGTGLAAGAGAGLVGGYALGQRNR